MGKVPRVDVGGLMYHTWNRANAGMQIFHNAKDYVAFERIVSTAKERTKMRILAYCIMPNHWHFVLHPREDKDLAKFFHWLTVTHATRWHSFRGSEEQGHVYQGTYKSNVCQDDKHFLQLVRYVERNALRANLVERAEEWRWSSGWRRHYGSDTEKLLLDEWPCPIPEEYQSVLNTPQTIQEVESIRFALKRGSPYGGGMWKDDIVSEYGLESTVRPLGRPKKGT